MMLMIMLIVVAGDDVDDHAHEDELNMMTLTMMIIFSERLFHVLRDFCQ